MNDLLDEIYQYLDGAQRYQRYIAALCPFHSDSRPSFFVYADSYYCAACNQRGKTKNLLDDLKKKQGTFIAKKQKDFHSPWSKWDTIYGNLESTIRKAHLNLLDHNKTAYLTKRGIDIVTIKHLKIGWLDDWITFPMYDRNNELIGATARAGETNKSTSKYCNYPGMSPDILYVPDWEMIKYSSKLFLVYGILDTASLYQLGYASASTTTGKRVDPSAFDSIRKTIWIIPDDGEEVDAVWLSARLGWRGKVFKMVWPDGCKDTNNLLVKHKEYLVSILEGTYGNNTP